MSAEYERLLEGKAYTELKDELRTIVEPVFIGSLMDTDKLFALHREYKMRNLNYFADLDDIEKRVKVVD